ncbi:Uncharacterized protein TCM_010509 [Theobroma cacao]|uniref:RNase H type-1 domain-containing protein n=1 Tax=Theobroma cacao TaxID=3641 RepID=A0A061E6N7_THECC|nr:Uncharacterized protein TCM_010509 [Theobroma cacao]
MGYAIIKQYREANVSVTSGENGVMRLSLDMLTRMQGNLLYSDVTVFDFNDAKFVGVGFIVCNDDEDIILASANHQIYGSSVEEVELMALAWSLSCCILENVKVRHVLTDCLNVVNWVCTNKVNGGLRNIIEDYNEKC